MTIHWFARLAILGKHRQYPPALRFLFAPRASNNIRSVAQRSAFAAWVFPGRSCLPPPPPEEDVRRPTSPPRDALARARPVGEPGVACAIGQAFDRGVAAETEILGARGA